MKTNNTNSQKNVGQKEVEYVEVLGDTVYANHLIITIIVSGSFGLGGFLLGQKIFPGIAPENMANSYSLLLGIAGLVIALIINSFLFKPKRKLVEEESTGDKLLEIFGDYGLDIEEEREAIKNNPDILKELKDQGIYNMFFNDKEVKK